MSGIAGFLGIDIGGTKVAVRVEGAGTDSFETTLRWTPDGGVHEDMVALARCLDLVRERWPGPLVAAGVAMPATLDDMGRVTAWPNRPGWAGLAPTEELRGMLPGTTVTCADDGDLAALAEARAAGLADLVYVGVGTGVGGGAVIGGELCPGIGRGSFEIGHLVIDRSGPRCDCGRVGCVQAHASGPAILRHSAELRKAPVAYPDLQEAWQRSLPWAVTAVDAACAALATAVTSAAELLHPEAVVIGGGFADGLPGFTERVEVHARRLSRPGHPTPAHRKAALGGLSSLDGAVLLAHAQPGDGGPADLRTRRLTPGPARTATLKAPVAGASGRAIPR